MATVQGIFWGESRSFGYPLIDLNGVPPLAPVTPTLNAAPLQLTAEGDWQIMAHSAVLCTPADGGLPDNTPINLQVYRQDNGENMIRLGPQTVASGQSVPLGAPLEHVCGKAGNPGYTPYPWMVPSGARLTPYIAHQAGFTPTGRTPLYLVAHALLDRGSNGAVIEIGSKAEQERKYAGKLAWFTARLNYSAASPLSINGSDTLIIPINTFQYFFVTNMICRAIVPGEEDTDPGVILPNDALNPLVAEDEILVSLKDTSNQSPFTVPGYVPLWAVFGNFISRDFHPPTMLVVRPGGSLEIDLKNGPTAAVEYSLEFTFIGTLVDKPSDAIMESLS